jgi:Subtilase family/Calx-beta domain/Peptidase inhibitor I9
MKKTLILLTVVLLSLLALSSAFKVGAGSDSKNKFRKADKKVPNQYIVVFEQSIRSKDVFKLAKKLSKDNHGEILSYFKFAPKGFLVEMSEQDAIKLSNDKDVEFVEENGLISVTQSSCPNSSATLPGHYGVDRLDQHYLPRDGSYCPPRTGRGVNVFVIDSGIWPTHDDFKNPDGSSRARVYYDVNSGGNGLDCNNHGTYVASTVGGNLYGVAKEANIYSVKVTSGCTGNATFAAVATGVNMVIGSGLPQKVINMSLGQAVSSTIDNAVRNAVNTYGIPVIAAAGNSGIDASNSSPARVQEAITVGAYDMSNTNYGATGVTEYKRFDSNYGPLIDVFAPGGSFVGSAAPGYFTGSDSGYDGYSGTSAAAPHVAGIAAMYLEAHPGAFPAEVQQAIVDNATTGVMLDAGPGSPNRVAYTNFLSPPGATVQFASSSYTVSEGTPTVTMTVTRTGSTANAASVKYITAGADLSSPCNSSAGVASQRCDHTSAFGTIQFAPGESSKTFSVLITDDGYVEPTESTSIQLSSPVGVDLGAQYYTTLVITDNDSSNTNPIATNALFVRQHYADFLNREPDPVGFQGWQDILNNCPPSGIGSNGFYCDRIEVSSDFFRSPEFQGQGYVIYRYYAAALGRNPTYAEFFTDLARISGFQTDAEREANKVKLFEDYAQRPEFISYYNSLDSTGYVDQLASMANVTLSNRDQLINDLNTGQKNRSQVLRDVCDFNQAVYQAFYNEAFVVMQYFGYLRRDPDASYLDWIQIMNNNGGDYRVMINGFMNSNEYVLRFGP